jgi:hypothetical protein
MEFSDIPNTFGTEGPNFVRSFVLKFQFDTNIDFQAQLATYLLRLYFGIMPCKE